MNIRYILLFSWLICLVFNTQAQLTATELWSAMNAQQCDRIAAELEATELTTEAMKFYGAVCYYRNGSPVKAAALFREVSALRGQFWHSAEFWNAKIHAVSGHDSIAVTILKQLPGGVLKYHMLTHPEFEQMAGNASFRELKASLKPGFNVWTAILSCIALTGFIAGLALVVGRSRFSTGERWLAIVVLAFSVILTAYITIWTEYVGRFPYLKDTWPFLTLLVGPSLYFYLRSTFREDITRRAILLHYLLPAVGFVLSVPAILGDFGLHTGISQDFRRIAAAPVLLTGQLLFYTIRISDLTQNEWQVDANIKTWTRAVALGMWLYTVSFISYFILVTCSFFNPQWDYAISFMMSVGILGITYMGFIQKRVFRSEPIETFLPVQKYQTSSLTPGASESIRLKLERILNEEQVFKENELRLDDLAAYLDITRHQLSQVINTHYQVNFFELINRYRIAYVQKVLSDPAYAKHTIIQIAYEAGFNNKASFNRYFKQATGLTPSAYRMKSGADGTPFSSLNQN